MAYTIDISFFFGTLNIAQKSTTSVQSDVDASISILEPEFLTSLLGFKLYDAYKAGIEAGSPAANWTALRDGKAYTNRAGVDAKWQGLKYTAGSQKKSLIANYVYWHWLKNEATMTTGTGEKVANNQNASNASPIHKQVAAWNEMVRWAWDLIEFLLSNPTDYPDFADHYARSLFYTVSADGTRTKNRILYTQNRFF